jgi:hypothetical protein
VKLKLLDGLLSHLIKLGSIKRRVGGQEVILNAHAGCLMLHVHKDDLIRDDAELLKSKCLHLSPGEALQDPGLSILLVLGNLSLYELNHDVVRDISVHLE